MGIPGLEKLLGLKAVSFASIEKCFKCAAAQACLLYLTGVCACAP